MKKILLTITMSFALATTAQVVTSENFNGLTLGAVGTDLTGAAAGQSDWFVFATNGAAPTTTNNSSTTSMEVVTGGNSNSQGLKIESANGDKGSRFMWRDIVTPWSNRTVGNDIIQVEYDFYTGAQSTSITQNGVYLFGTEGTSLRILAGFLFFPDTRELQGIAYLNNNGTFGNFLIGLGPDANTDIILNSNTWYRIGLAYNTTNGEITWNGPGFDNVGIAAQFLSGPFPPSEVDFVSVTPTANTAAATIIYDNLEVVATDAVELLSIEDDFAAANFSIFPNPASDLINVNAGDLLINTIELTDMNGRVVKRLNADNSSSLQINIQDLKTGLYMLSVFTNEGVGTSKIVKR